MAHTKIEKLKTPPEAASTTAAADAADGAPVVIPSAAADRELSDEDLDKVSGGTGYQAPRPPPSRAL